MTLYNEGARGAPSTLIACRFSTSVCLCCESRNSSLMFINTNQNFVSSRGERLTGDMLCGTSGRHSAASLQTGLTTPIPSSHRVAAVAEFKNIDRQTLALGCVNNALNSIIRRLDRSRLSPVLSNVSEGYADITFLSK